jgi:hypothetical protein
VYQPGGTFTTASWAADALARPTTPKNSLIFVWPLERPARPYLEVLVDADLDTLATELYVRTDDLLKAAPERAPWRPATGISPGLRR